MMLQAALMSTLVCLGQGSQALKRTPDVRCGSFSLQVALEAFGLAPKSFEELEASLGRPGSTGYTMAQLDEEAKKRGAQTLAVETTLEDLAARREKFACVTLLEPNHFVLLYDSDGKSAYLVDPPRSSTLPIDTFRGVWSRKALLIGREPFAAEESVRPRGFWARTILGIGLLVALVIAAGLALRLWRRAVSVRTSGIARPMILLLVIAGAGGCRPDRTGTPDRVVEVGESQGPTPWLLVEPLDHPLGDVIRPSPGATRDVRTTLKNVGSKPVRIATVLTSCACTVASIGRHSLAPGEATEMVTRIDLGDSPEPRRTALTLIGADPAHQRSTVQFTWTAINPLRTSPVSLAWMGLKPGEGRSDVVGITARNLALCGRCRIEANPSASVQATVRTAGLAPDASHDDRPHPGVDRPIGSLAVGLVAGLESTTDQGSVALSIRCDGVERARLDLPVSWSVTPPIAISPSRLSLGVRKAGESVSAKFVLRSGDATPFRITGIHCDEAGFLRNSKVAPGAETAHMVEVDFLVPRIRGPWRTTLRLETDKPGAESLSLPVSAVIDES